MPKLKRPSCDARALGANCDSCPLRNKRPVSPIRNRNAALVQLGSYPSREDDLCGSAHSGRDGKWLDESMKKVGVKREDCHLTTALLCLPPKHFKQGDMRKAIECCRPRLEQELSSVKATTVHAMGDVAVQAVSLRKGSQKWAGHPVEPRSGFEHLRIFPNVTVGVAGFAKPVMGQVFHEWHRRAAQPWQDWKWPEPVLHAGANVHQMCRKWLQFPTLLSFDIESNPTTGVIMSVALADDRRGFSVPWDSYSTPKQDVEGLDDYTKQLITAVLEDERIGIIAHNGQYDVLEMKQRGITVRGFEYDTLLAHSVVCPEVPHNLSIAAAVAFPAPRWKEIFGGDDHGLEKFTKADPLTLREYNLRDAYMTRLLWDWVDERLDKFKNGRKLYQQLLDLSGVGLLMKERGWLTSPENREAHRKWLKPKAEKHAAVVEAIAGKLGVPSAGRKKRPFTVRCKDADVPYREQLKRKYVWHEPYEREFNIRSPDQLKELFLERLDAPVVKRSPQTGEPSIDEEALSKYRAYPDKRVALAATHILEYRTYDKLLGTYVDGLPVDENHVCHPTANVFGAVSGRWSFKDPSIQVIPKPRYGKDGAVVVPGMRDIFVARPGMFIVAADYSQLELRILAALSGAKKLNEWYNSGANVHDMNAAAIFGDNFTKNQRTLAKNFIFGKMYGATDEGVFEILAPTSPDITLAMVQYISQQWQKNHPDIFEYQHEVVATAQKSGYVEAPISGRRRYFWDHKVKPTEVMNFPIQGTGADIMNPATLAISAELDWPNEGILAQIHDDLTLEVSDPHRAYDLLKKHMEAPVEINGRDYTFPVDVSVGTCWGAMIDVESREELNAAVERLRNQ